MRLNNDGSNILREKAAIRIPDWWQDGTGGAKAGVKTNTELKEQRRKSRIPDPSFDLDGDGLVSGRDFVLAKMFDKNGDGRLSQSERKNAEQAIKNVSKFQILVIFC